MKATKQQIAAREFAERWKGRGYEKGESQSFWLDLLQNVYEVENPFDIISFEDKVNLDKTNGFIDGYIASTKVMIEQKSITKDLNAPIRQSDGSQLTPFQQAKRYITELPYFKHPRWVVTCNFSSFYVYDMNNPQGEPQVILLENLEREFYRLNFLTEKKDAHLQKELEVSIKAGDVIGKIYNEFLVEYKNPEDEHTLKSLNVLCVRLVFCLYAEDAGIFGKRDMFHDYLAKYESRPSDMRGALINLFKMLNTPTEARDQYLSEDLLAFPYCSGGLFEDESIEIPRFNSTIAQLILQNASLDFDWSEISPTIFGAVFESTLNPETRRSGGMHYTSIENIHKVIDPLFLDDLNDEFLQIKNEPQERTRQAKLNAFHDKLASLKFLDPACGSGNFLTETYLSLRRLENRVILEKSKGMSYLGFEDPIRVNIHQFYGIEINDFAVATATTALWIAEAQTMAETEKIIKKDLDLLPLKDYFNIHEGNALRTDWEKVVPPSELNYIMGNPPFVGARLMEQPQKDDLLYLFGKKWENVGNIDYVSGWYYKASEYIQGTSIRCALVSTNSITQGEQVAAIWKPLFKMFGIHFDFAYCTFRWDSEATLKAHVHCVIIGFSTAPNKKPKYLFQGELKQEVRNINAYLRDGADIIVESRSNPLCDVPEIGIGNKPIDGGNYLFTEEEMNEFVALEPSSQQYFKRWYGATEFINNKVRYCLWLGECSPAELRRMPHCMKRVEAVRNFRLASKSGGTVKIADKPTRFHVENMPETSYIVIPETSSFARRYIPIGFMSPDVLCSNAVRLIPNASLYHFGVLNSNVHMGWMRLVAGRLKSDYRYSKDIVYNNFPWPKPTEEQKQRIEQTAQAILEARALYPDCSLADLYDDVAMPIELRKAHQQNDRAVMEAYGFPIHGFKESDCVAQLLEMYKKLTK